MKSMTTDTVDSRGGVESLTLAYRVKLSPSRVKSDTLAMLCALFQREHHAAIDRLDEIVAQDCIRQGDVGLFFIDEMPPSVVPAKEKTCILAYGEATGHSHHVKER